MAVADTKVLVKTYKHLISVSNKLFIPMNFIPGNEIHHLLS